MAFDNGKQIASERAEMTSRTANNFYAGLVLVATIMLPLESGSVELDQDLADSLTAQFESAELQTVSVDSAATLGSYLAYAAIQSPALRRAFYNWKSALEKTGYVGALPDPMISFGYFIENVETRVGPQEQKFSLKQTLPWFGTLGAKKDMARQSANAAFRKYEAEKLRLFYSVKAAYYDLYYLGRDIALTEENLELMKFWESIARVKYKVALKQHPDLIKAQVELGKLEDRLLTLKDKVSPTAARLRAIVNLPDEMTLTLPTVISTSETAVDKDRVLSDALENNPDLQAIEHLIDRERAGVRLAGKASLPSFTVGVDYIATGEALNASMDESGKDPFIVGVGINLPIWFGKNSSKKREAAARLQSAHYHHADAENRLTALVERIVFNYSDALRKTKLYRDGLIPKATQALNASYTAYQAGTADFLNVLDAQRQLLAFQLQFERALADLATRRGEIEMITGIELDNNRM
ncbi:MAG: TolC family protein [candidate division Zixibacteria bacterium]